MKSFKFLKDAPLAFTLRLLALITILCIVGINLTLIPGQVRSLKRGILAEISFKDRESKGYAVIEWVGSEARAMGISVGDVVLNPQVDLEREVGAPVTLLIKSGNAPAREVTFIPKLYREPGYFFTLLGLSPRATIYAQIILLWVSLLSTGLFSIVAFQLRLDAWLTFFVAVAFAHICALANTMPAYAFFELFIPSALIFFFIAFPTGKLAPRWSWLLILLPVPGNVGYVLIHLGLLERNNYAIYPSSMLGGYGTAVFLIILWGSLYEYRHKFTLFQRRWVNWLCLGLILINIPSWEAFLLFLGLPYRIVSSLRWDQIVSGPFVYSVFRALNYHLGVIIILMLLGIVVYRYYNIFRPVERQQMKWLIFGFIWIAGLFAIYYMFNVYYRSSEQQNKAWLFSAVMDKLFLLAAGGTVFCVLLALLRYGLNDIDNLIKRAFVYSSLLVMMGAVCLLGIMLVDSAFGESDRQNNLRALGICMAFIAVTFHPARRWLQRIVDERFRAEEFDFAQTFYEFAPDMYPFFSMSELSKILAARSVEEFGVTYASVYLKNGNGGLQHIKTEPVEEKKPKSVIDTQALAKLEAGELVFPDAGSTYSLIIPLVLSHGRKSDFIGALVLGSRLNGLGYSTTMINKLKSLGREIGKVLYVVRMRDHGSKSPARKLTAKRAPATR